MMKAFAKIVALTVVIGFMVLPVMSDETSQSLALAGKAKNALAMVSITISNETGEENQSFAGPAICIDAKNKLFITLVISANLKAERIKEIVMISPDKKRKRYKAKLLGVDTGTSIGFIQVLEESQWGEILFASKSNLKTGDLVTSVGLMTNIATFPPYVGAAYISSQMRMPDHIVRVTGGKLTGACSPVFNAKGQAVGIVGRQIPEGWQVQGPRGMNKVPMQGETSTTYFWPVEEFIHTWQNIPKGGKSNRLAWIGVVGFSDVADKTLEAWGLDVPAVRIDKIVPGYSADKAGVKDGDVIIAVDGKNLEELGTPQLTRLGFVRMLMRKNAGEQVKLTIKRGPDEKIVTVTTTAQPKGPGDAPRYVNKQIGLLTRERVKIEKEIDPQLKDGVVVLGMDNSSAAAGAGLKPGDTIFMVEGQPSLSIGTFSQLLEKALKQKGVCKMQVHRGEGDLEIEVRLIGQ